MTEEYAQTNDFLSESPIESGAVLHLYRTDLLKAFKDLSKKQVDIGHFRYASAENSCNDNLSTAFRAKLIYFHEGSYTKILKDRYNEHNGATVIYNFQIC